MVSPRWVHKIVIDDYSLCLLVQLKILIGSRLTFPMGIEALSYALPPLEPEPSLLWDPRHLAGHLPRVGSARSQSDVRERRREAKASTMNI